MEPKTVVVIGPPTEAGLFVASDLQLIVERLTAKGFRVVAYYSAWGLSSYAWASVPSA